MRNHNHQNILVVTTHIRDRDTISPGRLVAFAQPKRKNPKNKTLIKARKKSLEVN